MFLIFLKKKHDDDFFVCAGFVPADFSAVSPDDEVSAEISAFYRQFYHGFSVTSAIVPNG